MTGDVNTRGLLQRLWAHVGRRRRVQLGCFVLLVATSAVAEVMSLGLVIPFLAVLSDPAGIQQLEMAQPFLQALAIDQPGELLLPLTVLFCVLASLAAAVRFALVWAQTRLGAGIGNDLGEQAFRRTLHQPYLVHVSRNSSEVVAALMNKTDTAIYYVIIPLLNLAGSAVTGAAIVAFMLWVSPLLTGGALLILGGAYAAMVAFNRRRIAAGGRHVTEGQTRIALVVQEGLGGIREVLLGGLQPYFVRRFRDADRALRHAVGTIAILGNAPRYVVDALTVVTVGAVVVYAARGPGGLDAAIPTLGALALAIQRLMPMAQQAYFASTSVQGGRASLADLLGLLDQPLPHAVGNGESAAMVFERAVEFRGVTFRYPDNGRPVLADVSVAIPKGGRVGVIGETGSGKSTFLDLAMGLILPNSGQVMVDDVPLTERNVRSWQTRLAHVPQHIFLADASIARALYRAADLLVLDEATSALDDDTEDALVRALEGLGRSITVLTVAHRKRSLRGCDSIIEIGQDGTVRHAPAPDGNVTPR